MISKELEAFYDTDDPHSSKLSEKCVIMYVDDCRVSTLHIISTIEV